MAYRKVYGKSKRREKHRKLVWLFAALGLLLCLHRGVRETVLELLIPGDREITGQALEAMASRLREGEPLGQAAEAFCLEVLRHGG